MKIVKRDGHIVDYDPEKIRIAIDKANQEVRPRKILFQCSICRIWKDYR